MFTCTRGIWERKTNMRICVIRHGESETHKAGNWTGWLDVPLTEKGKADAGKAGDFLKGFAFDKVLSSDLGRAKETAEIALPGCCPETSQLLREIDVGNLSGKPISTLSEEERICTSKYGYGDFDGETREHFDSRIRQVIRELEGLDCENVALFTHRGWMLGFLEAVTGTPLLRKHVHCGNCAVGVFEFKNGAWQLYSWINFA